MQKNTEHVLTQQKQGCIGHKTSTHVYFTNTKIRQLNSSIQYKGAMCVADVLLLSRLTREKEASPLFTSSDSLQKSSPGAVGRKEESQDGYSKTTRRTPIATE